MNPGANTNAYGATPVTARIGTRRLSPLETAAAMAIILSCLVATAMMTGMLPRASQQPLTTVLAKPVDDTAAPAPSTVAQMTARDANTSPGASPARAAPVPQTGKFSAQEANAAAASVADAIERPLASMPAAPAVVSAPAASPVAAMHPVAKASAMATPVRPHRVRASHSSHAAGRPPRVRTREEVVAELLRSKHDGSYSSAMEAYR
ncbi:MAG: hypothetical protein H7234_05555 [Herminiimonas sp.]|nr:hypothetical protein [Herminiimonas sp.]